MCVGIFNTRETCRWCDDFSSVCVGGVMISVVCGVCVGGVMFSVVHV